MLQGYEPCHGAVKSESGSALLHLEFDALRCLFNLALTKKANIDTFVHVQKYIQLMHNYTFLNNNKTIHLKILQESKNFGIACISAHLNPEIYDRIQTNNQK